MTATTDGDLAAGVHVRPRHDVADVFRRYGDAYRQTHRSPPSALRVVHAIETCRTAPLGGHLERCTECGFERPAYNSCHMGSLSQWRVER